jgi:hypothetical protein
LTAISLGAVFMGANTFSSLLFGLGIRNKFRMK